ncbi:MAG: hypothetical protein HQK77_13395 [Desulfobacterales bacterium]|nr:hypothetical protein [Desulfobacterales bacterium]
MKQIHYLALRTVFLITILVFFSQHSTVSAQPPPLPSSTVKLIFIHHSTGGHWLADPNTDNPYGGLAAALMANNYYVSATNYCWGPMWADRGEPVGSFTNIPDWLEWFTGSNRDNIMNQVYHEYDQNLTNCEGDSFGSWKRSSDPSGENEVILFKSCFPNSDLYGNPNDPTSDSPTPWDMTVSNAKAVYMHLLTYFQTRQDKLFILITAPPMSEQAYILNDISTPASDRAANARAFNNWLVNEWLNSYPYKNVGVFDYYNVLTSNGGNSDTNDVNKDTGNHHRFYNGQIQHIQTVASNYSAYPLFVGQDYVDDHPKTAGQQKATTEFIPLLNYYYHRWKGSETVPTVTKPTVTTDAASSVTSNSATLNGSVNPNGASTTYYFQYGTGTNYTNSTETKIVQGTSSVLVSAQLSGLTPATMYYYRLVAENSAGRVEGSDITFTTPSASTPTSTNDQAIPLTIQERAGVQRVNEYVSFGVPLPRSWNATNALSLRVTDENGASIPAQFEILSRWGSSPKDTSAPAKWVLVGFFTSLSANAVKTVHLDHNAPGTSPAISLQIDRSTSGKLIVNTGVAQFELNTTGNFNLLNQVTLNGSSLLQSLNPTNAIHYEPAGELNIVSGGNPDFKPRVTSATVERSGELNSIVKVVGSILDSSSRALLDFTARLHFYAGKSDVRLDFTVENNQPVLEDEGGQPTNVHAQGSVNSVYIGSLKLALKLKDTGNTLRVLTEENTDVSAPASTVKLYQDSSGTDDWNVYLGQVGWPGYEISAEPRLQSYCTKPGFEITGSGVSKSGNQALGWMSAFHAAEPAITIAVKDFWQNFPKAIETQPDGTIAVDLFPNGTQFNHNFRVGEEKTHSLLLSFGSGEITASEANRIAKAFNKPLLGTASASWYISSGAMGKVPVVNPSKWSLYEHYVNVAFEPNPDFDPNVDFSGFGNTTLMDTIQKYNLYGWQDYGDVPIDYEAFGDRQAGQMNLKYWYIYGMLTQFCRSADLRWMDLAIPGAWHLADIDYLHIPDEGIQHWSHGAYFGHSQHDEPGCTNPNRNYNSPSVDLFFGVPDLILAYQMTGEQRFLDVAIEGLQAMENLSQFSNFTYPVFYRERANLIFAYMEGYRITGDNRWLKDMQTIIRYTADTSTKGWLNNPDSYVPPDGGDERISGFAIAQVLWSMGRYLDFCQEYALTDDLGVKNALQVYADFIINHMTYDIPTWFRQHCQGQDCPTEDVLQRYAGHIATIDNIWFTADYETYLETNDWALLMADVFAYAYTYTGQQRFLDTAAKLYETGTIDPVWLDDPPVYMSTKDLVNSLNWGLVYMNTSTSAISHVFVNQSSYQAGDRMTIDVVLTGNQGVDVYVAILLPNGVFHTITYPGTFNIANSILPYQTGIQLNGEQRFSIFDFILPTGIPAGNYSWIGLITPAGLSAADASNWIHYDFKTVLLN